MNNCIDIVEVLKKTCSKKYLRGIQDPISINCSRNKPLKINGQIAKLDHGETISIYLYKGSLKADIIYNQQLIENKINIISIGKKTYLDQSGNLKGIGMGVIFAKDKKALYIGEVKGLKGGSKNFDDIEDYNNLINAIKDNQISHVSNDLRELFSNMKIEKSSIKYLENKNLPEDIRQYLRDFIKIVNEKHRIDQNDLSKLKKEFIDVVPEKCYWKFFELFLELYCIRKLPVSVSRKIINSFTQDYKKDEIKKIFIKYQITDKIIMNEVDKRQEELELKYKDVIKDDDNMCDWTLITWINQVIELKKKVVNNLFQLLDKGDDFFKGKFFKLKNPKNCELVIADYIEEFKRTPGDIKIGCSGFSSVNIIFLGELVEVKASLYREYGLSKNFNKKISELNKEIIISELSQYVHSGKYKMTRSKDIEKMKFFSESRPQTYVLQFYNLENEKDSYTIKVFIGKISHKVHRIKLLQRQSKIEEFFQYEEMDKFIRTINYESPEPLIGTKESFSNFIVVDFNENINRRKMQQLELIKAQLNKIRAQLKNRKMSLKNILNEYIKQKLTGISPEFLTKIEDDSFRIKKQLEFLVKKYDEELNIKKTPEEIITKLSLQAYFETLVTKKKSIDVQQTMELLSESKAYTDKIEGKEIFILLGGTGSGKSSTACYLMKANMHTFTSRFGDEVVDIDESDDAEKYPKIGQSVGTSETLYVRGFELKIKPKNKPEKKIMLCDCPGFHDTRGTEHEICTNYSIDRAIKKAAAIKGVVLVIQYASFLQERGQPVIESFQNLIDILPDLLNDESLLDSVFLIITKVNDSNINLDTISDRIMACIDENARLLNNQSESYDDSSILDYKLKIWTKIQHINSKGHLFIIQIDDIRLRTNILNSIYNSQIIPFNKFSKQIISKELYKKYADFIEIETHSWIEIIFPIFMNKMPDKKANIENKKIENEYAMKKNENNEINKLKNQAELFSEIKKLIKEIGFIYQLELKFLKNEITNDAVQEYLRSQNNEEDQFESHKYMASEINDLKDIINGFEIKLIQLKKEIEENDAKCAQIIIERDQLVQEKENLETGSNTEELMKFMVKPNDELFANTIRNESRILAVNEVRNLRDEEYVEKNIKLGYAKNYRGEALHIVLLDKKYRIVPRNNQEIFFKINTEVESDGKFYKAVIDGKNFEIDLNPKASADGKKMVWPIKTTWKGKESEIPWFIIYHTVPNIDINEATITNIEAKILDLNKTQLESEENIKKTKKKYEEIDSKIKEHKNDLEKKEQKLSKTKHKSYVTELSYLRKIKEEELQTLCKLKKNLRKHLANIKEEKENNEDENKMARYEDKRLQQERKFVALSIYDRLEMLKNLFEFCKSLTYDSESQTQQIRKQSLLSAEKYIEFYNEKISNIKSEISRELDIQVD